MGVLISPTGDHHTSTQDCVRSFLRQGVMIKPGAG